MNSWTMVSKRAPQMPTCKVTLTKGRRNKQSQTKLITGEVVGEANYDADVMYTIQPKPSRLACASCGSKSNGFKFCKGCFGSLPVCKTPSCKKKANMNRKYCAHCEKRLVTCRGCQRETVNQNQFCDKCFAKFF